MRLIDADALKKAICEDQCERDGCDYTCSEIAYVYNAPTVELTDEAAIEHLHKSGWARVEHGYWSRKGCAIKQQYDRTTDCYARAHRCSVCNSVSYFPIDIPDDYCRRCGAKMDELMPEPPEEDTYGSGAV